MCGIAGFLSTSFFSISKATLIDLKHSMNHRGPDDFGHYQDLAHGVNLLHSRLSIQDLSPMGHQPMMNDDGTVVLVFNGEIYNFHELREELITKGHIFHGQSDTEVLLHMYLAYRDQPDGINNMLRRLNGIFAFVIWDSDRSALMVARDAFGVKPIYFCVNDIGFFFASEIKILLKITNNLETFNKKLNSFDFNALERYSTYLWNPGDSTPLVEVKKVAPGEIIWIKKGKIAERLTWYKLPVFRTDTKHNRVLKPMNASAAVYGTESHLRNAVQRQLLADVPIGAFLSGGLDSSSIVALAKEQVPNIQCYTIQVNGMGKEGMLDDLPYAKKVAKHLNVNLEVVNVDASKMAQDLPAMVAQLDEPIADLAPLNILYISQLARRQGIKVLLSGAGGDDLFSGYRRHRAVLLEKYWSWLPKSSRVGMEYLAAGLNTNKPIFRRLRKFFNGASLDGDERLVNYFRWIDRADLISLYTKEFKEALRNNHADVLMLSFLADIPPKKSQLERILALEQRFFLTDHNLTYTDKMSMAVGVEVRVPFLDLDLVDFAATIPAEFKQRGSEGKWVLKKVMEPYLPREVIYRAKSGFGVPVRLWLRNELRDLLGDILSEKSLRSRGLFDSKAVKKLIIANDKGWVDASYTLLSLMCIELWCRHFIDKQDTSSSCSFAI